MSHKAEDITGGFRSSAEFWQNVVAALIRRHGDCILEPEELKASGPNDDTLLVSFPGHGKQMHLRMMGRAAAAHIYEQHKRDAGRRN